MMERSQGSIGCCAEDLQQALAIHTKKITDSCRDKDCIEDLRVYLTTSSQEILDRCTSAKVRCADLLYTYIDVEPVAFDRNHYCIDLTFYYRILADATVGLNRPVALQGLAMFTKRAVLCGEDSRAHIYTSRTRQDGTDGLSRVSANHPTAVVEGTAYNSQGGKKFCPAARNRLLGSSNSGHGPLFTKHKTAPYLKYLHNISRENFTSPGLCHKENNTINLYSCSLGLEII